MRRDIYEVLVTKTTTAYIAADSYEDARADADEMSFTGADWVYETETHVMRRAAPVPDNEPVWTGGPDGDWVPASEFSAEEGVR